LDKSFISVGIPDMRGLEERNNLKLNGQELEFVSGIITDNVVRDFNFYNDNFRDKYSEITPKKIFTEDTNGGSSSGLSANIPTNYLYSKFNFEFDLKLKGSERLAFVPLGKTTDVKMSSNWASPSFDGSFLPDERELNETGFSSNWHILDLNRNYPQSWVGGNYNIYDSVFGVSLIEPVDGYQKSNRSIAYAILIIALTFLIFLSFEIFNRKKIHPVQYILVGLSLVLFYALLISISEILGFNLAYGIASLATIGLIVLYSNIILKEKRFVAIQGGILVFLYAFVYILLQLEDYALFIGSVGLFIILSTIMYLSRKIDWYSIDNGENEKY
jgi:inner membrane protein